VLVPGSTGVAMKLLMTTRPTDAEAVGVGPDGWLAVPGRAEHPARTHAASAEQVLASTVCVARVQIACRTHIHSADDRPT